MSDVLRIYFVSIRADNIGMWCLLKMLWPLFQGAGLKSLCFDMKSWWEAWGQELRLCLCGLLSGLIGNRCGKAGGWAASQSSWEKLKTIAFLETGGITVGGRGIRSERQRESF